MCIPSARSIAHAAGSRAYVAINKGVLPGPRNLISAAASAPASSSISTHVSWPASAVMWRTVICPVPIPVLTSTPASNNAATTARWLHLPASERAIFSPMRPAAPRYMVGTASRPFTTSRWPATAAAWSGDPVPPETYRPLTLAPILNSHSHTDHWLAAAAACSAESLTSGRGTSSWQNRERTHRLA